MKNDNLALLSAIILIVALLASVVVLLVAHIITLDQVGPFLLALVVPLTAIASLPIFKAALAAPSPEQTLQLHGTLNQAVQSLAQVAQPAQVLQAQPEVLQTAPAPVQPVQPQSFTQVQQVPFEPITQMTAPLAAIRQSGQS